MQLGASNLRSTLFCAARGLASTAGSSDASAAAEHEFDGTPSTKKLANVITKTVSALKSSDAPAAAEHEGDGTPSTKMVANVIEKTEYEVNETADANGHQGNGTR